MDRKNVIGPSAAQINQKISKEKMIESAESLNSELCPDELEKLREILRVCHSRKIGGKFLEIGTAAGGTLVEMMKTFEDAERPEFWVVDVMTYFHDQLDAVMKNLKNNGFNPETVQFYTLMSKAAYQQLAASPPKLGFVLIDADHELHGVTRDLRWVNFLEPGGFVCMHDYVENARLCGVTLAADRFLKRNPNFQRRALVGSLLVIEKVSHSSTPAVPPNEVYRAELLRQVIKLRRSFRKRWASLSGREIDNMG